MNKSAQIVEKKYLIPFILITSLFALWGFANDITNPMVAAFKTVMELTNTKATLIQFAFYGGYATMASRMGVDVKLFIPPLQAAPSKSFPGFFQPEDGASIKFGEKLEAHLELSAQRARILSKMRIRLLSEEYF